jgi:4a-hydroxytetrahydrobiopterin dehydratase
MPLFTTKEINEQMKARPEWTKRAKTIRRTFQLAGFPESIDFVRRVARKAQTMNHHPDINIRFDTVTLALSTQDEGGLTEKDFALAAHCDEIFARYFNA